MRIGRQARVLQAAFHYLSGARPIALIESKFSLNELGTVFFSNPSRGCWLAGEDVGECDQPFERSSHFFVQSRLPELPLQPRMCTRLIPQGVVPTAGTPNDR